MPSPIRFPPEAVAGAIAQLQHRGECVSHAAVARVLGCTPCTVARQWPEWVPRGWVRPERRFTHADVVAAIRRLRAQGAPVNHVAVGKALGCSRSTARRYWPAGVPKGRDRSVTRAAVVRAIAKLEGKGKRATLKTVASMVGRHHTTVARNWPRGRARRRAPRITPDAVAGAIAKLQEQRRPATKSAVAAALGCTTKTARKHWPPSVPTPRGRQRRDENPADSAGFHRPA